jgi:hypothetical protein
MAGIQCDKICILGSIAQVMVNGNGKDNIVLIINPFTHRKSKQAARWRGTQKQIGFNYPKSSDSCSQNFNVSGNN